MLKGATGVTVGTTGEPSSGLNSIIPVSAQGMDAPVYGTSETVAVHIHRLERSTEMI